MNKKTRRLVIALLGYSAVLAGIFYLIGYKSAYDRMENAVPSPAAQTFYATISDMRSGVITVRGMEVNDINFRGEFCFSAVEETQILWRNTEILLEDLDVGDHISITFTGAILETSPAQIEKVAVIGLLDDEK